MKKSVCTTVKFKLALAEQLLRNRVGENEPIGKQAKRLCIVPCGLLVKDSVYSTYLNKLEEYAKTLPKYEFYVKRLASNTILGGSLTTPQTYDTTAKLI